MFNYMHTKMSRYNELDGWMKVEDFLEEVEMLEETIISLASHLEVGWDMRAKELAERQFFLSQLKKRGMG